MSEAKRLGRSTWFGEPSIQRVARLVGSRCRYCARPGNRSALRSQTWDLRPHLFRFALTCKVHFAPSGRQCGRLDRLIRLPCMPVFRFTAEAELAIVDHDRLQIRDGS